MVATDPQARPGTPSDREVREQEELLRELHDLLTAYAPRWYSEDLDTRLRKCIANFSLARSKASGQA